MRIFLQNDPEWKDEYIVHRKYNLAIGREGCLLCSLGSVMGLNPKELNGIMMKEKVYRPDIIRDYSTVTSYMANNTMMSIYDLVDWNRFNAVFDIEVTRKNVYSPDALIGSVHVLADNIFGRKKVMTVVRFSIIESQDNSLLLSTDTHDGETSLHKTYDFYDFLEVRWK